MARVRTVLVAAVVSMVATVVSVAAPGGPSAGASPGPNLVPMTAMDVGTSYACGITSTGVVRCWGNDGEGQLGNGPASSASSSVPIDVVGLPGEAVAVTTGYRHACALVGSGTGTVWCWGSRSEGQTGTIVSLTSNPTPEQVDGIPAGVVSIAAGEDHVCAATELGEVWCWGEATDLQLGGSSTTNTATPVQVVGLSGVDQVAAGTAHTCAHKTDGSVWCWGRNDHAQLGRASGADSGTPTAVAGIGGTTRSVTAGGSSTCAITTVGGLRCWGFNVQYQLGDGTTTERSAPVTPTGLGAGVRDADLGELHGCAVTVAGAARCWGRNDTGAVGIANRAEARTPTTVSGLASGVRSIAGGRGTTCAVLTTGGGRCWGGAFSGELGDGTVATLRTPGTVTVSNPTAAVVGGYAGCALQSGGTVRCWGTNPQGILGDGSGLNSLTPVAVSGVTNAVQLDMGEFHACIVNAGGTLKCWGSNSAGQLGRPIDGGSATPTTVSGLSGPVAQVSVGDQHTCVVTTAGAAQCWGDNPYGGLGDGTETDRDAPVTVSGLGSGVASISAGRSHTCAVLTNGTVRCWGFNSGALGNNSIVPSNVPVAVSGIASGATAVSAGGGQTCAIVSGAVKCWGSNIDGESGEPTSIGAPQVPYAIASLSSGWTAIATGDSHSCARSSAGEVRCWGSNRKDQLGVASDVSKSTTPVTVIASGASTVEAGPVADTTCSALAAGSVSCWGDTAAGQAGADPGWTPRTVSATTFAGGSPWAPFPSWGGLVDQQYLDLLGRSATTNQRNAAVAKLTANTQTPGELLSALRQDADQTGAVDPTTRLYFAYFLRIPDKGGLTFWIGRKRGGWLLRTISDNFAGSSEFERRYGSLTNQEFVELIYNNLFARVGDPGGIDYWTRKLDTRAESRGGVMAQFSESSEYKRKMASEVSVSVLDLLVQQRQPSQVDFDSAVARLDEGALTEATLAGEVLVTPSYLDRFS